MNPKLLNFIKTVKGAYELDLLLIIFVYLTTLNKREKKEVLWDDLLDINGHGVKKAHYIDKMTNAHKELCKKDELFKSVIINDRGIVISYDKTLRRLGIEHEEAKSLIVSAYNLDLIESINQSELDSFFEQFQQYKE